MDRRVRAHAARGGLVLGICNGFQMLCESGLLPGVLMRNAQLRFICRRQHLRVERQRHGFHLGLRARRGDRCLRRHGEGNYVADPETLARLEGEGRVAFRYCDATGALTDEANCNGSLNAIAGNLGEFARLQRARHDAASREP